MSQPADSSFTFLPLGAIIQEFRVGGQNIVLNFATPEQYRAHNQPFFGETIGRVANRIKGARIETLNGKSYQLAANNGPNSLHGGSKGWGKKEFDGPIPLNRAGKEAVLFKYVSPDGDEGYPGTVELRVWYTASVENEDGVEKTVLEVEYEAEMVGEENINETVIAVTNHSYFNLTGGPSIEGTEALLSTNKYLEVDDTAIPTGSVGSFPGIKPYVTFTLGRDEPDVDHCFIKDENPENILLDTRAKELGLLAKFFHPESNIHLEILSSEPAFQFYTGKFINVPSVDGLPARGPRAGFCVEPSRYINAPNVDKWKGMVVVKRGQKWGSRIVYRSWKT